MHALIDTEWEEATELYNISTKNDIEIMFFQIRGFELDGK